MGRHASSLPVGQKIPYTFWAYILENSKVLAWLNENYSVTHNDADRVGATELYNDYRDLTGDKMLTVAFANDLKQAGILKKPVKTGTVYMGIKRNDDEAGPSTAAV